VQEGTRNKKITEPWLLCKGWGEHREEEKSITLYEDVIDALIKMPEKSMAAVTKAILCSTKGIETPELDTMEAAIYQLIMARINE